MCCEMETNKWLWQPNKNGPIHLRVQYKDLAGKKKTFTRSLRTRDWRTARKIRDTEFTPIILDVSKAQAQLELIHELYPQLEAKLQSGLHNGYAEDAPDASVSIKRVYDQWVKALAQKNGNYRVSPKTASRYSSVCLSFILFHGPGKNIHCVSRNDVIMFRDKRLIEDGRAKKTVSVELNALRNFFAYAGEKHGVEENPADKVLIKTTKAENNRCSQSCARRPPTHEEADTICRNFPIGATHKYTRSDCQDFAMFARYTGLRQAEIAQLRADDFVVCKADQYVDVALKNPRQYLNVYSGDVPAGHVLCIHLRDDKERTTKTGEVRLVPIAAKLFDTAVKRVKAAVNNKLFPFAEADAGSSFGRYWLKRVKRIDEGLTMHGFRHYCTSEMENNNVNSGISHMVIGHNPGKVHDEYFHKTVHALKDAVDRIN